MGKQWDLAQTNFTAGEISKRLYGRFDIAKYANGLARCYNFVPQIRGPIVKRPGTKFVAQEDGAARLIPFNFSRGEGYVIAMGDGLAKFYRNGAYLTGKDVAIPYSDEDLASIQYVQSADVMFIVSGAHAPQEIRRTGVDTFALAASDLIGPFDIDRYYRGEDKSTIDLSVTPGSPILISASAALFSASDVGAQIRLLKDGVWNSYRIDVFVSVLSVEVTQISPGSAHSIGVSSEWRFSAWNSTSGYPETIAIHQQRMWFGGSGARPQTIWGSQSGNFVDFRRTDDQGDVQDDSGMSFDLDSDLADAVTWMLPSSRGLLIGTANGEHSLRGTSDSPITPTSVTVLRQGTRGSQAIRPLLVRTSALFVHHTGRRLLELGYSIQADGYIDSDVTLLADQAMDGGALEVHYQQEPDGLIYVVTAQGKLWACTYEPAQEVIAWHQQDIGEVLSMAVAREGDADRPYFLVRRDRGVFIEQAGDFETVAGARAHGPCLDSHLLYSGSSTSTLAGLGHLEGSQVYVVDRSDPSVGEGVQGPYLVSGGQVQLDAPVSVAAAGLRYDAGVTLLPLMPRGLGFETMPFIKSVVRAHVYTHGAAEMKVGFESDSAPEARLDAPRGIASGPYYGRVTGLLELATVGGTDQVVRFVVESSQPVYSQVTSIAYRVNVDGDQ